MVAYTNSNKGHKVKNFTKVWLAAALLGVAGSGLAGEKAKHVMAVEVAGDSTTDTMSFELNSEELGFDLDEMQIGETRSIVDEAGRPILITRNEDGFSFNVDGKVIDLPDFHTVDGHGMQWIADDGAAGVNVHVIKGAKTKTMSESDGTVIISSTPIDETTRQSIQTILESAGHSGDVEFIDHSGSEDGQVFIKKIDKVVDQS